MKRLHLGFLSLSLLALQSGCDSIRNTLGLDHYQADAFSVPTNPPLTIPPDFNLRPPTPGAAPTNAQTPQVQAQKALKTQEQAVSTSKSESTLITATGQKAVDPNIRDVVNKEAVDETTLEGKVDNQLSKWKKEAKENIGSLKTGKKAGDKSAKDQDTAVASKTAAPPTP